MQYFVGVLIAFFIINPKSLQADTIKSTVWKSACKSHGERYSRIYLKINGSEVSISEELYSSPKCQTLKTMINAKAAISTSVEGKTELKFTKIAAMSSHLTTVTNYNEKASCGTWNLGHTRVIAKEQPCPIIDSYRSTFILKPFPEGLQLKRISQNLSAFDQRRFTKVEEEDYDQALSSFDDALRQMRLEHSLKRRGLTGDALKNLELEHMTAEDQYMRGYGVIQHTRFYTEQGKSHFNRQWLLRFRAVDTLNTARLKQILSEIGWFSISRFGEKADKQAWLIVQHADHDPSFQRKIIRRLEQLLKQKDTNPSNFAYLYDRIAASWNDLSKQKPQRFGTQGRCVGPGAWEPIALENPEKIDEIRKSVGLGTLAAYKAMFKEICK
ncbi:MAG: hypothetical protein HRU19_21110 [Pseudobacteriovorax sp.]|nr:hypothetical protein [Pseudobacteriovorax sp.]